MTLKIALVVAAVLVGLWALLEISLRLLFGFGNPLIYIADEQIGYLLAPDQSVRRFGNRIQINAYSMRSPAVAEARSPQTLRVLLLGDSVANGGWWTDQTDTVSEMLQRSLQFHQSGSFAQVELLNASANSWSPRNELAYLQRFGTFDAQVVVLLINTDDLFGTTPTSIQIGRDRNYPDRKPPSPLVEVITRYLLKAAPLPEMEAVLAEGGDRVGFNLEAIQQIQAIVTQSNGQLLLAMTPLLREVTAPGSRDYELKARERLQEFTQQRQILYVDLLPIFKAVAQPETLYRDHIHPSPVGNQQISQSLIEPVQQLLSQKE